jgi:hypothetical protein
MRAPQCFTGTGSRKKDAEAAAADAALKWLHETPCGASPSHPLPIAAGQSSIQGFKEDFKLPLEASEAIKDDSLTCTIGRLLNDCVKVRVSPNPAPVWDAFDPLISFPQGKLRDPRFKVLLGDCLGPEFKSIVPISLLQQVG